MDGSRRVSSVSTGTPSAPVDDFDRSSPLSCGRVLHRMLQDGTDQDYYVYLPTEGAVEAPVFVAVHDVDRDARGQADAFASYCERHRAVLVAPHFASDRYPNYQRLGRSRFERDERRSANETLDAILEEIATLAGVVTECVYIFGFGGGGRFAMRYSMLNPERVAGAVIVEPGAYTFPDENRRFPQGIAPSRKRPDFQPEPSRFLRVPMTLMEAEGGLELGPRSHLEDVDRSEEELAVANGRAWVDAMTNAASAEHLPPRVRFHPISPDSEEEGRLDSFLSFSASDERIGEVFEALSTSADAALPKESSDASDAVEETEQEGSPPKWPWLREHALKLLLVVGLVAAVTPIALWGIYRSGHVVSRDAVVRGHIADVGAPLDGVVRSVEVDQGDRVVAGQIVVRLEDRQFAAERARAASQLEKALRELEVEQLAIVNERSRLQNSLRGVSADLSAANAEVQVAESRAQEALRRLELQRSLASEGLVATERVRAAETEYRTARALVAASKAERNSAIAGEDLAETDYAGLSVRERRISVLESEISALEAELRVAEANLEGAVIRAPDDGAVIRRIVEPGASTTVGQPIMSLWIGREIWVEAWVDESELGKIGVGSRATVTFMSHPNEEFSGKVDSMAVSTDIELPDSEVPQPRRERMRDAPVVSVRVKLDRTARDLFPGLSAVVAIRKKDS